MGSKKGGGVRWKSIFYYQTWGGVLLLIAAAIITAIAHFAVTPQFRTLKLFDATVSQPMHEDTVPIVAAGIIPFVALVITVIAVEFGALHRKQSLTMAIHATIHIIFWSIVAFAFVLAITEATKPWASRYRPDFMSRCKPAKRAAAQPGAAADPAVTVTPMEECKGRGNMKEFDDGRKSFPSGHSSASLCLCWFTLLYFCHALYYREGLKYLGGLWGKRGCGGRLLMEILQAIFILWAMAVLSIAWCIGVTRYRDNRHNIDDILGGFVVALLWTTPVALMAFGQLNYFQKQLIEEEEEQRPGLPTTHTDRSAYHSFDSRADGAADDGAVMPSKGAATAIGHAAAGPNGV